jgi:hypothetical protein
VDSVACDLQVFPLKIRLRHSPLSTLNYQLSTTISFLAGLRSKIPKWCCYRIDTNNYHDSQIQGLLAADADIVKKNKFFIGSSR